MDNSKINRKLERIRRENAGLEKEAPYNFCDRWCQRCTKEKQSRCHLYLDDFEREITCIAYGKNSNDPEVIAGLMDKQIEELEGLDSQFLPDLEGDCATDDSFDVDDSEEEAIQAYLDNHPLQRTAEQYRLKARDFLKDFFHKNQDAIARFNYDFETIAWYHTLLAAKMHRALYGLYEANDEDEFGLCDAVAQLAICKKAINESVRSLRELKKNLSDSRNVIVGLLAILNNISSRIIHIEEDI